MKIQNIIRSYTKCLKNNDYDGVIKLFAKDAEVFSFLTGKQHPAVFFKTLFNDSTRSKVKIINIYSESKEKNKATAHLSLTALLKNKHEINFEAVDLFEFDSENKIRKLQIILDTHPIRILKEKN